MAALFCWHEARTGRSALEKADQVAPGLIHRYPDRVLFVVTSFCSSYCRFCIRKRNWVQSDAASTKAEVDQAVTYLRVHEEVR